MRRVVFLIDQRQDFFVSLAWAVMLRRRSAPVETVLFLTHGEVFAEFRPYLSAFDTTVVVEAPYPPRHVREIPAMIGRTRRFQRDVRALGLRSDDVAVFYSFRALVATAFVRVVRGGPRLVRVRQCNHEMELGLVRRRVVASFYWNLWNRAFGAGAMRYRWLPTSNRVGAGVFLDDPYDDEFCLTTAARAEPERRRVAWPFPVLREAFAPSTNPGPPALVFLGEKYPLLEGQDVEALRAVVQDVLDRLRAAFPHHRLVFKPRSSLSDIGIDLDGWELGPTDVVLESLLISGTEIEKVYSFKSSGSYLAALYGCEGYALYPLLDLPANYAEMLDEFFAEYRDAVAFVDSVEALAEPAPTARVSGAEIEALTRPLVDLLAGQEAAA